MNAGTKKFDLWSVIKLLFVGIFGLFLVYPLFNIFKEAVISPDGHFTLEQFVKFFSDPYYSMTIWNSLKVTVAVTLGCLLIGVPFSYFYSFYRLKGTKFLFISSLLCCMSAPFIGAYSWIMLLGRSGVVTKFLKAAFGIKLGSSIYGFSGIVLVQVLKFYPLVLIYMNGAFRNIDNSLIEAAENMGCTGLKRFFKIVIKLTMPTLLAAALLVFMRAFADFGTPLLIGEGYRTFTVEIYNQYMGENGTDHSFAAAISILAVAVTAIILLIQKYATNHYKFSMSALHPVEKKKATGIRGILMHVYCYGVVAFAILPQLYIIYLSFRNCKGSIFKEGYSLNNYISGLDKYLFRSIGNTLVFGVISLIIIIVFSILIAYIVVRRANVISNAIDVVATIPYVIPGAVVGIAMIISFNKKPLNIVGTMWIMILALVIRRIPYTIRSATATLMSIPMSIEEASVSLGTSKMKTLMKVTVPMMASGITSGAILSWVAIITELSSGIILYNNKNITLTVATYVQIVRGNYGVACAFATVLTVFTVISMIIYLLVSKSEDNVKL
ncbi:MAG: iron ABC transporter permease [Lachnospiraceae bacterium]|nr:iron ABC transporter permease [Lachnospiraceae bacterium]